MKKIDLKEFTFEELRKDMEDNSLPSYRADQIFYWMYRQGLTGFDGMTNLSLDLRRRLAENCLISSLRLEEKFTSADGTEKFLFRLEDGNFTETVLIPAPERETACVSTQVGCRFGCPFCASGRKKFVRDLTAAEMVNQLLHLIHNEKRVLTNVVFMGMGEPLDNCDNLIRAIKIINDPKGLAIGARRITVSTCGLIPGIERLKELGLQIELSLSLHSAKNGPRDDLVPANRKYPLEKLLRAAREYSEATGRKLTFEYVLLKDVNDSAEDAIALADLARKFRAKVNLIAYNPVPELAYEPPEPRRIEKFQKSLYKRGIEVTLRASKGGDIAAACGQLAGRRTQIGAD